MSLEDVERDLQPKLDGLDPRVRAELLNILMTPDYDRARRIGDRWLDPKTRTFAELLMDLEESPHPRALVLGGLRERELLGE